MACRVLLRTRRRPPRRPPRRIRRQTGRDEPPPRLSPPRRPGPAASPLFVGVPCRAQPPCAGGRRWRLVRCEEHQARSILASSSPERGAFRGSEGGRRRRVVFAAAAPRRSLSTRRVRARAAAGNRTCAALDASLAQARSLCPAGGVGNHWGWGGLGTG